MAKKEWKEPERNLARYDNMCPWCFTEFTRETLLEDVAETVQDLEDGIMYDWECSQCGKTIRVEIIPVEIGIRKVM